MIDTVFLGPSLGGSAFFLTVGGFFKEREYSGADWLDPVLGNICVLLDY